MTDTQLEYTTRDSVLKLLSDAEVASVTTAETADRLPDGDEYLDLHQLGRGVQRASASNVNMNSVLPRKAVHEGTWSRMLTIVDSDSRRGTPAPAAAK
jgi:hypothetical protein